MRRRKPTPCFAAPYVLFLPSCATCGGERKLSARRYHRYHVMKLSEPEDGAQRATIPPTPTTPAVAPNFSSTPLPPQKKGESPGEKSGGEFLASDGATAGLALEEGDGEAIMSTADETSGEEFRIGVPSMGNGARVMREGLIRLVQESNMTGSLRLPTGSEAAMFAWDTSLVLAMVVLLRAGVQSTLRWIHNRVSVASGSKTVVSYEESIWECIQRPLESVSVFTVATILAEIITAPLAAASLARYLRILREVGFIFCATWFLIRWIERIRTRFASDKRIDKVQADATSRVTTVATIAVSILVGLDTVGINVQTVLAFGGIGGVAIGFAGREIISNFFGGFMIFLTRPFTVGEWIRSIEEAELNGTVEDIGWYLTRVRTWDKRPLYIPNSRFSTLIVENGSRMANRRILHTLNLRIEDTIVLPKIVADLTKMMLAHSELDPRQHRMAYVDGFSEYSALVWLSCYTKSVFLYDFRRVQQEILLNAHEIIRSYGARLATKNTRDVRPGIDVDKYGPFGNHASYATLSNEPKVNDTPEQTSTRFKLSDIPGAPFFSRLHNDDILTNIESGVSEESIAAALRMESATPLPTPQVDTPLSTNGTNRIIKPVNPSTTESPTVPAAADNSPVSATAGSGNGTMKISTASPSTSDGPQNAPSTTAGTGGGDNSTSSGTMKISSAVPKSSATDATGSRIDGGENIPSPPSGTMKISTAPKPQTGDDTGDSSSSTGTMKISTVPKQQPSTDAGDGGDSSDAKLKAVANEGDPPTPMKMNISAVPKNNPTAETTDSSSGKLNISAVRKPASDPAKETLDDTPAPAAPATSSTESSKKNTTEDNNSINVTTPGSGTGGTGGGATVIMSTASTNDSAGRMKISSMKKDSTTAAAASTSASTGDVPISKTTANTKNNPSATVSGTGTSQTSKQKKNKNTDDEDGSAT